MVGLTCHPEHLIDIRRSRMRMIGDVGETAYVDPLQVEKEVRQARRLFAEAAWPVIDVTDRSIEETARRNPAAARPPRIAVGARREAYNLRCGMDQAGEEGGSMATAEADPASHGEVGDRYLVLASQAAVRAAMLRAAGLSFSVQPARVDEGAGQGRHASPRTPKAARPRGRLPPSRPAG